MAPGGTLRKRGMRRIAALQYHQHSLSAVGPDYSTGEAPASTSEAAAAGSGTPADASPGGAPQRRRAPAPERGSAAFRFWTDERRFKTRGDECIVQKALFAAGGVRTGGYPKASPIPGPLGHQRHGDWDLLWSPARTALRAVPSLKPGQLISAMPGMYCLTKKRRLSTTLHAAYGERAWSLMPLSFALPGELAQWRAWLDAEVAAGRDPGPWMLKTAQHLGKGLKLLPGEAAYVAAQRPRGPPAAAAKPFVVAQRYVADPLLLQGRKFGIRLWVVVTGLDPLRAYVHGRGLVLFSSDMYDSDTIGSSEDEGGASRGLGHITNYAQNVDGMVWSLDELEQHLGQPGWQLLWQRLQDNAAAVFGAAVGELRGEHASLGLSPNSTFELLGLDYLVDEALHPWLLEVNGTPSLAVDHQQPEVEELIRQQKAGMAADMVALLACQRRFQPRYSLMKAALAKDKGVVRKLQQQLLAQSDAALARQVQQEMGARGGFLPLMGRLPMQDGSDARDRVPWSDRDRRLQAWLQAGQGGGAAKEAAAPVTPAP